MSIINENGGSMYSPACIAYKGPRLDSGAQVISDLHHNGTIGPHSCTCVYRITLKTVVHWPFFFFTSPCV